MRHTRHLGQVFCQSCTCVTRVLVEALRRVQLFSLEGTDEATPNLAELAKAGAQLQQAGFVLPTWLTLSHCSHPPAPPASWTASCRASGPQLLAACLRVLAATKAAAYLRNKGAQVARWEEAIPGQAYLRPRGDEPSDR